ncbi:hypothetical protein PC9H_005713 [Pleurotus ostreatus]|uniref:Uncharacterized protein n=1 Tax=Pleurotus ostreatus TaxID=5322 RepID=A0A8H7DXA7_PLEOS|nr:uncharacterized protein PC9H_005713 [Pleurotus ostreatus]KAF7433748.1 hypothetical protein PC9H_005713 [Pleurotus ostreatus]
MITSPHLRPHVRRTALYITEPDARDELHFWTTSGWFDEEHTTSLISSFPNLNYADCSSFPLAAISFALPQLPITTLHLQKYSVTTDEFLDVLAAGAQTLQSLTVMFIDCYPSSSPPADSIPTIMSALKELRATCSMNLPLVPERIQMPSLQTLFSDVDDFEALSTCLPVSFKTLVIHTVEEAQSSSKILHVENLCLISENYWDGLPSCIDTIDTFTASSSIKHLELVLHKYIHSREPDVDLLHTFEEFLLNLHETGSFERLTLTFPGQTESRSYEHVFPSLRLLGLLDAIRMESSPISLSSGQR